MKQLNKVGFSPEVLQLLLPLLESFRLFLLLFHLKYHTETR